jgi:hypothetical protein
MISSFFLLCFLLRSSFLFLHFHFLLSSCLLILPTTHVVLCFIPFPYSGTQHIEYICRRTNIIYKLPNGYKPNVLLLSGYFHPTAGNNYLCRQSACLELATGIFCSFRDTSGKCLWTV